MSVQENNVDQTPYKIVFSNILCRIKINEQGLYGLVIRLGKKSSKYSDKNPILNGALQLNNILQVPFDDRILSSENIRRDKCEIMLYRYKMNGERQSKELIGMASLGVERQFFQQQRKKLRLTNSIDKEACVQFKVKIQLGEADILSVNQSKMSSFFLKSNQNSIVKEIPNTVPLSRNEMKIGLLTSSSQKSCSVASQSNKEDNSILQILTNNSPQNYIKSPKKLQKSLSKSQSQYISVTQPTAGSQETINSNIQFQQEKYHLLNVCNDLQKQNQLLISKIENLQNQIFNQSMISNSSINDRPQIPRPAGSIKKSPMIKKNTTITVTPTFQKQKGEQVQIISSPNQRQLITQKSAGSLHSYKAAILKANQLRKNERQSSPHFFTKNPIHEIQPVATIEESQIISHMTFGGQKFFKRNNKLTFNNVIGVIYKPPLNKRIPRHQISYNERQNSVTNQSVSDVQRKHSRSYSKFSGKKKYQAIGTIKSPDQSQNLSYLQQQSEDPQVKQSRSYILSKPTLNQKNEEKTFINNKANQKQGQQNILKTQGEKIPLLNTQKPNFFLNFLNENEEEENSLGLNINQALQGVLQPSNSKQNIFPPNITGIQNSHKSRITLQELDMKTQQRFRKNERALKIANMKILEENISLKKQKKALTQLISQKKQLSHQQFQNLRNQINILKLKVEKDKNSKLQSQQKINELLNRCTFLEQENSKLKRDIKQQKTKYEYYLKMSNINDHKNKQKDLKRGSQVSIESKRTSIKQDSGIFNSIVETSKSVFNNEPIITSIMNISNKESGLRKDMTESKSLKKTDFIQENKTFEHIKLSDSHYQKKTPEQTNKPNIPKPNSSFAVSKLKQQLKSGVQRNKDESFSMVSSPMNNSFSASGFSSGFTGGLIGTGDTIVQGVPNVFSSFGQK